MYFSCTHDNDVAMYIVFALLNIKNIVIQYGHIVFYFAAKVRKFLNFPVLSTAFPLLPRLLLFLLEKFVSKSQFL